MHNLRELILINIFEKLMDVAHLKRQCSLSVLFIIFTARAGTCYVLNVIASSWRKLIDILCIHLFQLQRFSFEIDDL